jgi:hypothetical protein
VRAKNSLHSPPKASSTTPNSISKTIQSQHFANTKRDSRFGQGLPSRTHLQEYSHSIYPRPL